MLDVLTFVLAAMAVIVVLQYLADRTGLPAAALLTVAGLVYGVLPGPNVTLDPHVILTFVIPPLNYSAAQNSSLLAIRENMRTVISLSIGLVLATAVVTGIGMDLLVPGVGLAAGIALGAALSPTDPVAALAVGGRAGLPPKLITIIEGEGLLNDATALTTLTVAVTAATSGGFSFGGAVLRFLLAAAGGLLCGVAVAIIVRLLRSAVRDPLLVNGVSLATPFAAYLLGEELHVSGVLAVAVAGLMIGHETPRFTSGASRLQATAVWHLADFLLQGFVFLLVGQQIAPVIRGLKAYPTSTIVAAVAVSLGVVLLLRPLWLALTQSLPRRVRGRMGRDVPDDQYLSGREIGVLSWAGTRGVISLAAIFTLPLTIDGGRPFPGRDLLLFCTYLVVVVTLVGQGLTFAPIAHANGDPADAALVPGPGPLGQAGLSRLTRSPGRRVPGRCYPRWGQPGRQGQAVPSGAGPAGDGRGSGAFRRHGHRGLRGRAASPAGGHRRPAGGTAPLAGRRPPARRQPAHPGGRARSRGADATAARRPLTLLAEIAGSRPRGKGMPGPCGPVPGTDPGPRFP